MRRETPEQKQIRRGWMQKVEEQESEREEEEEEENRQREGQIVSKFCSCQMENNRELGLRETNIFTFPLKSVQTSHQYHISTSPVRVTTSIGIEDIGTMYVGIFISRIDTLGAR